MWVQGETLDLFGHVPDFSTICELHSGQCLVWGEHHEVMQHHVVHIMHTEASLKLAIHLAGAL